MPPTSKRRALLLRSSNTGNKRSRHGEHSSNNNNNNKPSQDGRLNNEVDNNNNIRAMDPLVLTRGMAGRHLPASSHLSPCTNDEMERDLRHMEAYASACKAYAQQLYLYTNHMYSSSSTTTSTATTTTTTTATPARRAAMAAAAGTHKPPAAVLPVRIDPEEEKRLLNLRKRIVVAEAEREVLETEYMSLTASFVQESKSCERVREYTDGELQVLQELVRRRGRVLALQRVRCAMARDIYASLQTRTKLAESSVSQGSLLQQRHAKEDDNNDDETKEEVDDDVLDVWNEIESELKAAERECRSLETEWTESFKNRVVPWEAQAEPRTPRGVPILASQLSRVPDRGAAYGCNGMFGSDKSSLCWLLSNLPKTTSEGMSEELAQVRKLEEEDSFLKSELQKERDTNKELHYQIGHLRRGNDRLCATMALLRSETEALVHRHNVLLDTPEARAVSQDLHTRALEDREEQDASTPEEERSSPTNEQRQQQQQQHQDENDENVPLPTNTNSNEFAAAADLDHDGDDEDEETEEEEEEPGEVVGSSWK